MAVGQDDIFVLEKGGNQYQTPFKNIANNENIYYSSLSGNHTIDHKYKSQYWTISGNVTVLGTSLAPTGYSTPIVIYIDNPDEHEITLPVSWDIAGEGNANTWEILVLEIGRYVSPGPLQVSGWYLNANTLKTIILQNTLTSTSTTRALTANMGKTLKDLIDALVECPPLLRSYDTYTVATLPSSPTGGDLAVVTDGTDLAWRGTVAGGGSATALVMYDGTNWIYH